MVAREERIASAKSYIDEALEICGKTRVEFMYDLEHLIRSSAMIVEPNFDYGKEDLFVDICWYDEVSVCDSSMPLRIYPFFREDIEECSEEAHSYMSESHGFYNPLSHVVSLTQGYSEKMPFMRGCLFLHEVSHAFFAIRDGRAYAKERRPSRRHALAEELAIYEMEMLLWRERSPSKFQSILDEAVACVDLRHQLSHPVSRYLSGEILTHFPVLSDNSLGILDDLLGPFSPCDSADPRVARLRLFAHLELINRSYFLDSYERKLMIMQAMHEGLHGY